MITNEHSLISRNLLPCHQSCPSTLPNQYTWPQMPGSWIHPQAKISQWLDPCTGRIRFLSDAESRYATIELELLAVVWAVAKCKILLEGLKHFHILTDYNLLVPILNNWHLDEIKNLRLQRLKSHLMAFNFTTQWVKGSHNNGPDALLRNPITDPQVRTHLLNLTFTINQKCQLLK